MAHAYVSQWVGVMCPCYEEQALIATRVITLASCAIWLPAGWWWVMPTVWLVVGQCALDQDPCQQAAGGRIVCASAHVGAVACPDSNLNNEVHPNKT